MKQNRQSFFDGSAFWNKAIRSDPLPNTLPVRKGTRVAPFYLEKIIGNESNSSDHLAAPDKASFAFYPAFCVPIAFVTPLAESLPLTPGSQAIA